MTPAQLQILKTAINADPVMAAYPMNGDGYYDLATYLNQNRADFYVNSDAAPVKAIFDVVGWAKYTPTDTPDDTQTYTNRALAAQCKQINLQVMLTGREVIDCSVSGVRAGLQDATSNLPTGAGGGNVSGGWANVKLAIQRLATRGEAVFATGTGSTASPAELVFKGQINPVDVEQARNLA